MAAQREIDEELKELLQDDLKKNFDQLVSTYASSLFTFVLYRVTNSSDAQDILQDIFVSAYLSLKSYSPERYSDLKLRPWLYTIANNKTLNYITRSRKKLDSQLSVDIPEVREQFENTEQGQSSAAEVIVENKETTIDLYAYILRLPRDYRDIIVLHYILEMEYSDIAKVLQQPMNTVKSKGRRGLMLLQRMSKENDVSYDSASSKS